MTRHTHTETYKTYDEFAADVLSVSEFTVDTHLDEIIEYVKYYSRNDALPTEFYLRVTSHIIDLMLEAGI